MKKKFVRFIQGNILAEKVLLQKDCDFAVMDRSTSAGETNLHCFYVSTEEDYTLLEKLHGWKQMPGFHGRVRHFRVNLPREDFLSQLRVTFPNNEIVVTKD